MSWETLGIWLISFLTLCIFSFLYDDNPFYKFAEHLYVGVSAAYGAVIVYMNTIQPDLVDHIVKQDVWYWPVYFIPLALCFMVFTKLGDEWSWMARWPLAFVVGAYSGAAIPAMGGADVVLQMKATMLDLTHGDWFTITSNVLLVVGTLASLVYFFFSTPHEGAVGITAKVGIGFLMISFGASFGYTVMARVSLAVGRAQELIKYSWASITSIVVIVIGIIIYTLISGSSGAHTETEPQTNN